MTAEPNLSLDFARQIIAIGSGGLRPVDRDQVRYLLLLDCLAVSRAGAALPWTKALTEWAGRFSGSGKAPIVGTRLEVAPSVAALINGTAAHGYELDDTHDASMSHPGAVVIPVASALAAEVGASADELLAAIACGYEAMTRVGVAADAHQVIHDGYHPTALFGGFGAAAAAARLLRLDAHGLARAWGHVLSLAGGSMQFSDEPEGTAVKRLHAGYAAQNGVLAAELAARGVSAPARALDGKYGFLALYAKRPRLEQLVVKADVPLQVHGISIKPYSCCRLFHSLIDGLREVSDDFGLPVDAIRRINVSGPGCMLDQHMMRRPASVMAAQYSMPFIVGATLAYGPHRFDAYRQDRLGDVRILGIVDKVEGAVDGDIEAQFPAHMGTAVTITSSDGSERCARVMDSRGTPANPLSLDELVGKAQGLMRDVDPNLDITATRASIWGETDGRAVARLFAATA
jgi:2-methylcitrate dehydratase PrpD